MRRLLLVLFAALAIAPMAGAWTWPVDCERPELRRPAGAPARAGADSQSCCGGRAVARRPGYAARAGGAERDEPERDPARTGGPSDASGPEGAGDVSHDSGLDGDNA